MTGKEFRKAFSTPEGQELLINILMDHQMFQKIDEKTLPLRNYGINLLTELGFFEPAVVKKLVEYFFQLERNGIIDRIRSEKAEKVKKHIDWGDPI